MDAHRIPQTPTVIPLRRAQRHPRDNGSGLSFGRCRLLPAARLLLRDDREVALGDRAFDLLQVLVASPGVVLSKEELIARVWPTTKVEEGNLRFQVCGLRRALGPDGDLIRSVAGRGYLFAGTVEAVGAPSHVEEEDHVTTAAALAEALASVEQLRRRLDLALDRLAG